MELGKEGNQLLYTLIQPDRVQRVSPDRESAATQRHRFLPSRAVRGEEVSNRPSTEVAGVRSRCFQESIEQPQRIVALHGLIDGVPCPGVFLRGQPLRTVARSQRMMPPVGRYEISKLRYGRNVAVPGR